MNQERACVEPVDASLTDEAFLAEVLSGLAKSQKSIPPKYLYDRRGSELFDRICELDEYYLTRAETEIMVTHRLEIANLLGSGCVVIEFGSGSSIKTRILLNVLDSPVAYVPVDISREHLHASSAKLAATYPDIEIIPICADFTKSVALPSGKWPGARRISFCPGSTIGNFERAEAIRLLERMHAICGPEGGVLIGVDLAKDPEVLKAAYDDSEGVTAEFNLNLLRRLNRDLDADFDLNGFRHQARYVPKRGRIEMHLESLMDQVVSLGGVDIAFERGETIHTESSHKYTPAAFAELAAAANLKVRNVWVDENQRFSVQFLTSA